MAITADYDTLMRQAPGTAQHYMLECAESLDRKFGEGYAKDHPELLAAMIKASASDFNTACLCVAIQEGAQAMAARVEDY